MRTPINVILFFSLPFFHLISCNKVQLDQHPNVGHHNHQKALPSQGNVNGYQGQSSNGNNHLQSSGRQHQDIMATMVVVPREQQQQSKFLDFKDNVPIIN